MGLKELQLEKLRKSLLRGDGQISHGLNLVLKLKDPAEMLNLLVRIEQAQRKIHAGLGELNFVHFARFLPTADNTALQVVTEFDGPLSPYVLDFAIEIGDVFDMLLGYTEDTEHIVPIAEHPAEFLAFVEKHNTVTVPSGIPGVPDLVSADWPVYSAYRERSVLDILGARTDLPTPKTDRWTTPVERSDVQGNILRGYRAERVKHFVLRVDDAGKARKWLANIATPDAPPGSPPDLVPGEAKPSLMCNVGLTYRGMQALGIREPWLAPFPEAFRQGPVQRATDNFDTGDNAPGNWWLGGPNEEASIHVVVSMYQGFGAEAQFNQAIATLSGSLAAGGLVLLREQEAFHRNGMSWFGYVDGVSNPRIATGCPVPEGQRELQPASTAGEFVLGAQYKNIYGGSSLGTLPPDLATNGSFCAIRILQQDTQSFAGTLKRESERLNVNPDWLAAKLMGRWYNGAPLSLHPDTQPADKEEWLRNDFDYEPSYEYPETTMDHAGERCPVGAHVRRSNPRTARVAGARYTRRLMRRGMHYDITDDQGRREVGLFGIFICADLERQFEFIQRHWINGDRFAAGLSGTRDPIAGTLRGERDVFMIPMPDRPALEVRLPQFVFTKGSVYTFMPGLEALRQLDRFATEDPPAAPLRAPARAAGDQEALAGEVSMDLKEALAAAAGQLTGDELLEMARVSVGARSPNTGTPVGSPGNLPFDPRRRDFQIDPYPVFAAFRAEEPVHYSPLYEGWFVFGYDDVVRVCTENDNFSAMKPGSKTPPGLFTLDPPAHDEVRHRLAAAWIKAAANTPAFVESSIAAAIDSIGDGPCFDLVDDFARRVPRDVYFDILGGKGIPAEERLELDRWARKVMKFHDQTLSRLQRFEGWGAGKQLGDRLFVMLNTARKPGSIYEGGLIAHLAGLVDWSSGTLNPKVAVATLVNLTVAGYMSVEFLLATGIRRLLLDRAKGWNVVRNDSSKLPLFLEEMRRTEHALSVVDRFARRDIKIGGVAIPAGAPVFGVLASANRDEKIYGPDADQFNPYRHAARPHLGLGWGTHECMGRLLEKSITEPTLQRLTEAMPGLRLQSTAQPPWFENFYFRSFDHLALTMK